MRSQSPTELKFEEYIEQNLITNGFISLSKSSSETLYENYKEENKRNYS